MIKCEWNRNTKNTSTSIACGDIGEVDGDAREVGGNILVEGNIEVADRNDVNSGGGMVEPKNNERNGPLTPSINN